LLFPSSKHNKNIKEYQHPYTPEYIHQRFLLEHLSFENQNFCLKLLWTVCRQLKMIFDMENEFDHHIGS